MIEVATPLVKVSTVAAPRGIAAAVASSTVGTVTGEADAVPPPKTSGSDPGYMVAVLPKVSMAVTVIALALPATCAALPVTFKATAAPGVTTTVVEVAGIRATQVK